MNDGLYMEGICKSFSDNIVLKGVNLQAPRGKVLALLGENGAGKSTLIKILNGDYEKDDGSIYLDGQKVVIDSPADAAKLGVRVIYQELNYVKDTTVIENVLLGHLPTKNQWFVDWKIAEHKTRELVSRLGADIDPYAHVAELSIANKQLVEIAKALSVEAQILVLDEPTAALTEKETKNLFRVIRQLRDRGVSIIYISHRLEEISEIADFIMVMRDGLRVAYRPKENISIKEIVSLMVGHEVEESITRHKHLRGNKVMQVKNFSRHEAFHNVSFDLHAGEIVGLFGLLGSGKSELTRSLFGVKRADSGSIFVKGKDYRFSSPAQAMRAGLAYVPADRKVSGLVLGMSIEENLMMASLQRYSRFGFVRSTKVKETTNEWVRRLSIKLSGGIDREIKFLSGGNQQKVILSRWLETGAEILILSEPTLGVDIGSRADIYQELDQLRKRGMAILVSSSDMNELEMISDRIIIMRNGEIVAEKMKDEITQEAILAEAMGV